MFKRNSISLKFNCMKEFFFYVTINYFKINDWIVQLKVIYNLIILNIVKNYDPNK